MQIYNTMTAQLEPFEPQEPGKVKMYVCGPTVYGLLHIGNGRTFMFMDVARRYLAYKGYAVTYVQNFTDVDDKIIARAAEEGISPEAVAEKYTQAYFADMEALGVARADAYPRAVETIPEMIAHIQGLIDKGFAYAQEGDVYFRVSRFEAYGKLSKRDLEDQLQGARKELDVEKKEDPLDFALWKGAKPGEPAWESPWGPGRPGWHIECSAMVRKLLGDTIDIHAGGVDLKFPHHENEIAQSEALTDKPFVRYWMHGGFLKMESEKMSKSLGNVKTIRDVVAAYGQQAVRVFLLSTKYRKELDFSDAAIKAAEAGFLDLRRALGVWADRHELMGDADIDALVTEANEAFESAMDYDFSTPSVIAHWNETAKRLRKLASERPELEAGFGHVVDTLKRQGEVLGLDLSAPAEEAASLDDALTGQLLELLIDLRKQAKAEKNWALADAIRNRLKPLGIQLVDQKDGTTTWELAEQALV